MRQSLVVRLDRMAVVRSRFIRSCIFILGIISIVLGAIGAFTPVLPTTPFVLLAAWCFLKSSEKAHAWLYRQPLFGKSLQDWERNRSISRSTKLIAIFMIVLSVAFIWVKVDSSQVRYSVTLLLLLVSAFILTRD